MSRLAIMRVIVAVTVMFGICVPVFADGGERDVSPTVWYQGFLADVDTGDPVNGSVTVVASIYDLLAGGTMLWGTETHAGTVVTEGWFNIELGSSVSLIAFDDPPYYLELTIAGELLEPRQKLASVPMALQSARSDSASAGGDASLWTEAGANVYRPSGNVGIGTASPASRLDVSGTAEMTGFKLTTSPTAGYVLTSDSAGNGTWQAGGGGGDSDWTVDGNDMYATVSGDVGIGTSTPGSKLDVEGTVQAIGLRVTTNPSVGDALTSDASGNATWQPQHLIDVHDEETVMTIGSAVTQYDDAQVSLTVPGPGYIICTSTVRVTIDHASGAVSDHLQLNHSTSASLIGGTSTLVSYLVLPTEPIGGVYRSFSVHSTHYVGSAGTYTYYLVGRMASGQSASDEFNNAQMTAVYYPI